MAARGVLPVVKASPKTTTTWGAGVEEVLRALLTAWREALDKKVSH